MKRILTFIGIAVFAAGTATAAWAHVPGGGPGGGPRGGPNREAFHACVEEAKAANPGGDREALKPAVKACLEAKGITLPDPGQRAERKAQMRACFEQAKADHPGDRAAVREAVRECMGK